MKTFSLFSFLSFFVLFIACQKENGIDAQSNLPEPDSTFTIVEDFSDTSNWEFESSLKSKFDSIWHYLNPKGVDVFTLEREQSFRFKKTYPNSLINLNPKKIIFKAILRLRSDGNKNVIRVTIGNKFYNLHLNQDTRYFTELEAFENGTTNIKSSIYNETPVTLFGNPNFISQKILDSDTSMVTYVLDKDQFATATNEISIEILLNNKDVYKRGTTYGDLTSFVMEKFELTVVH